METFVGGSSSEEPEEVVGLEVDDQVGVDARVLDTFARGGGGVEGERGGDGPALRRREHLAHNGLRPRLGGGDRGGVGDLGFN